MSYQSFWCILSAVKAWCVHRAFINPKSLEISPRISPQSTLLYTEIPPFSERIKREREHGGKLREEFTMSVSSLCVKWAQKIPNVFTDCFLLTLFQNWTSSASLSFMRRNPCCYSFFFFYLIAAFVIPENVRILSKSWSPRLNPPRLQVTVSRWMLCQL